MIGLGEFFSLACGLSWAIAVILFTRSGESLGPFALNLFKNVLAAVMLGVTILLWQGARVPDMPPVAWALVLLSGVLGIGAGDTLYFAALNRAGAARIAIAGTLYSPFVIALSLVFLGERMTTGQWLGVALVIGGVLFVSRPHRTVDVARPAAAAGVTLGVLAMAFNATGIVIAKPLLEVHDFLWIVWLRLIGGIASQLVVIAARGDWRRVVASYGRVRHWPHILIGSILGTYVTMLLWLAGYKYAPASVAAILNEMAQVFILILAAVFLRDRLRPDQLVGALVATLGVVLVVAQ